MIHKIKLIIADGRLGNQICLYSQYLALERAGYIPLFTLPHDTPSLKDAFPNVKLRVVPIPLGLILS